MFINRDFLLETDQAKELYHDYAAKMPIIDYHCHLDPKLIAEDYQFANIGELWLSGDHYKWRAMRAHGVDERYCTGNASGWEKFYKWAETVPYTMRNPLYHWTHLELKTAFGIDKLLSPDTAKEIYHECSEQLKLPEFSARGLMKRYRVEVVCTTDDPISDLHWHQVIQADQSFDIKVLPTWRPDKAMAVENAEAYHAYVHQLSQVSGVHINSFTDLIKALRQRHDYFAANGCSLSDHGLDVFYTEKYTLAEVDAIFKKVYEGETLTSEEVAKFKSAMLYEGALMDDEKGWVQQFHYGALRNNNTRAFVSLGADTGYDSIGDRAAADSMARFFDRLSAHGKLTKTIVYNLNPAHNDMVATMLGNFQDGTVAGKMQFGSGWWFLDQKNGIENQLNSLSNMGLLSHFVGMLTDSRSFLSYPRHEYFRRILANLVGKDVHKGLLPASEMDYLGKMIQNISYYNAKEYFKI